LHLDKKICHENKKVSNSFELHKDEKDLSLISNKKGTSLWVYGYRSDCQGANSKVEFPLCMIEWLIFNWSKKNKSLKNTRRLGPICKVISLNILDLGFYSSIREPSP
jgi:hypothetical protein